MDQSKNMNRHIWGLSTYESAQAYLSVAEYLTPGEELQFVTVCLSLEWGLVGPSSQVDTPGVVSYHPYLLTITNFRCMVLEYSMRKDDGSRPTGLDATKSLTKKTVSQFKSLRSLLKPVGLLTTILQDNLSEELNLKMRFTGLQVSALSEIIKYSQHSVSPGLLRYAKGPDTIDGYRYHAHLYGAISNAETLFGLQFELSSGPQEHISGDPMIFEILGYLARIHENNERQIASEIRSSFGTHHDQSDPFQNLERLAGLLSKGIITQEEFDNKKAQMLQEM